ncbi:MAG: SUMF1/EgtB/PvdO family nonheme iron enzyme [Pseudomonadota bacterium]
MLNSKIRLAGLAALVMTATMAQGAEPAAPDGMVLVPAGEFVMGSDKTDKNNAQWRDANALNPYGFIDPLYVDEYPPHKVNLNAYFIDKYEVTNAQYRDFVISTGRTVPLMWPENGYNLSMKLLSEQPVETLRTLASDRFKLDMDTTSMTKEEILPELQKANDARDALPVTGVTWSDAAAYCAWANKRLPTEAEWEKAARGPKGYEYPWGNEWKPDYVGTMANDQDNPAVAGGSFPNDKSGYGVYDMSGNVAEWVADWYNAYPGSEYKHKNFGRQHRVVRGGFASSGHYDSLGVVFRTAKRSHMLPYAQMIDVGFRCAKDAK